MKTFNASHYVRIYDAASGAFRALSAKDILCMGAGSIRRLNVNGRYVTISPLSVTMGRGGRTLISGTIENGEAITFYARIQDAPTRRYAFVAGALRPGGAGNACVRFIRARHDRAGADLRSV